MSEPIPENVSVGSRAVLPVVPAMRAFPVEHPAMQGILEHRTRLGELVRRMSVIGATVGGVLFVLLLILLLWPDVLFDRSQMGHDVAPGNVLGLLSAASFVMSGMLCFYCLRARGTLRRLGPEYLIGLRPADAPAGPKLSQRPMPFLKSDLNKARLMAAPMLVCLLLMFALYRKGLASGGGLISLAVAGACLGCCLLLIAVRRSAWEIARIEGASFDAVQRRGFAVLAPGGSPVPIAAIPIRAGGSVSTLDGFSIPPPVVPITSAAFVSGEGADVFSEWETLLHGIFVLGLGVYIFSVPEIFEAALELWRVATARTIFAPLSGGQKLALALDLIASATATCWVSWCIVGLALGPRFRKTALVLAWVSMGVAFVENLSMLLTDADVAQWPGEPDYVRVLTVRLFTASLVFPVITLLLLRRSPVKQLFAHHPRK